MLTANELKVRGVKAIEEHLKDAAEVPITVRGRVKYVAMSVEHYDALRASEILMAYQQTQEDIKHGAFKKETAEEHVKRVWK